MQNKYFLSLLIIVGLLCGVSAYTLANPEGGQITAGNANITKDGSTTTINQHSDKIAIDWQSFNIGTNESVIFQQPDLSSIALNRIIANDASRIYGTLAANGQVFLINPNGILFSSSAQVNTGGLVASSLNLSKENFLNDNYTFIDGGGKVTNLGEITASEGGYVALLGSQVANMGIITAQKGTVALGAGQEMTLDFNGDGLLSLAVDKAAINAQVKNNNLIQADGGQVLMTASTADALAGTVINNSGIIKAQSIENRNGSIILKGGSTGTVVNSGTLDSSGQNEGETGGTVKVLGDEIVLANNSFIDVSGDNGGGTALIGGNYQGSGSEQHATNTTVESNTVINADAYSTGDGGKVVVWSDETTSFAGTITARGGSENGNGGSIETSGKQILKVKDSASVITTAEHGSTGNWLLDPADILIAETGGDINIDTLETALGSSNVTIQTDISKGTMTGGSTSSIVTNDDTGNGDITLADSLNWGTNYSLTLSAYRDININDTITNTAGGNLTLRADNTGSGNGTVNFGGDGSVSLNSGITSIYYNPDYNPDALISKFVLKSGNELHYIDYIVNDYTSPRDYSSNITGYYTAYMLINDIYDLQAVDHNLSGNYALSKDIDASNTYNWFSFVFHTGFNPIGPFNGIFDGDGHIISDLYINRSEKDYVGLFSHSRNIIRNVGLVDSNITGNSYVGGLVGSNSGTIENSYNSGEVSGNNHVGGLVGSNSGTIKNSYNSGVVNGNSYVGGLVGQFNSGNITSSYWDTETSGVSTGIGGTSSNKNGLTTEEFMDLENFTNADWDVYNIWRIYDGYSYPLLRSFLKKINVSADSVIKVYDGQIVVPSGVSYFNEDGLVTTRPDKVYGTLYEKSLNVGIHKLTGLYSTQDGYDIIFDENSTLTINPKEISYSVADTNSTYGTEARPTVTFDSLVSGDEDLVNGIVQISDSEGVGVPLVYNTEVGTYIEYVTGLTGEASGNYVLATNGNNIGTLNINPKEISYSVADASSTYGTTATPGNVKLNDLVSGDENAVNGILEIRDSEDAEVSLAYNTSAGTYTELLTGLEGDASSNYVLATDGNNIGTLTINPTPLIVTAEDANWIIGRNKPEYTAVYNGLIAGDTIYSLGNLNYTSSGTADSGVGIYTITPYGLSNINYNITYLDGRLTVRPDNSYNGAVWSAAQMNSANDFLFSNDSYQMNIVGNGLNLNIIEEE